MNTTTSPATFITADALLAHWQGHRRLTRRMIEAFPEDKLFTFSVGSMRPFGSLVTEMNHMAAPMVHGVVTGQWKSVDELFGQPEPKTREALLALWDQGTKQINELWPQIPPQRFHETITAFGQYTGVVNDLLLYIVDNETHHRGQGYVYLRALGIDPPPFYERK